MKVDEVRYAGHECIRLRTDSVEVTAAHSAGPRILSLRRGDTGNLLAVLPEETIELPRRPVFRFIGGHRLWAAPEVPDVTYAPDDASVDVTMDERSVTLAAPIDGAGLQKTMTISLEESSQGGRISVDHTIANHAEPRTIAPWAITQLVPGGTALVPLGPREPDPYQAASNVVAWPYTRMDDALVRIEHDRIEIEAKRIDPIKFGTTLRRGWLAYQLDALLFVKRSEFDPAAVYPDLGANGQCYATRSFLELETLGPLRAVDSGESVVHRETWELHDVDPSLAVKDAADSVGLR